MIRLSLAPFELVKNSEAVIVEGKLAEFLKRAESEFSKIVIVTHESLDKMYLQDLKYEKIFVPEGEQSKSFTMMEFVVDELARLKVNRNSLLVAIGGGVIGDLAGFCASVYLRGIAYWQVPTSLLAMVDSAVGGKTGINTKFGKNLVGITMYPEKIICDLDFLRDLPEKEILNGLGEMIKHCFIADKSLFESLKQSPISAQSIERAVRVKLDIIARDPFEKNERKYLNLGHTFGHAIEKDSDFSVDHGMAVSIGLALESKLAFKLGILPEENLSFIMNCLQELNLPVMYKVKNRELFMQSLRMDKKNTSEKITFALVREVGKQIVVREVKEEIIEEFLYAEGIF